MALFISFDDGLSYHNTSEILSFGINEREPGEPFVVFKMRDGHEYRTSRPISEVAEMLPTVNVWY